MSGFTIPVRHASPPTAWQLAGLIRERSGITTDSAFIRRAAELDRWAAQYRRVACNDKCAGRRKQDGLVCPEDSVAM